MKTTSQYIYIYIAILDKINNIIRTQTQMNQWRNTSEAISWFKEIKDKHRKSFISFDIIDFYPSISEDLLDKAITWAKRFTNISDNDITIIKHARKSLLFHMNHTWSKRNSNSTFDVAMGSYDGAEINALSCDRQTFDRAAPTYNDALSKSNFNVQLEYEQHNNTNKRQTRQRNVLWYNPRLTAKTSRQT